MLEEPGRPLATALRVDGRQLRWLDGRLLALPPLFLLRLALTRLAGLALPDPRTALVAGMILYLLLSLARIVRLLPALIGVLLGDREAGLGWSWRATRDRTIGSVALILFALAPLLGLHVGINLFWLAEAPIVRLVLLVTDGPVMALVMMVAMASYRALWLRAKAAP